MLYLSCEFNFNTKKEVIMNNRKTLTIIMAISMILGSYRSFAQTAEELFPKAIQLEEVKG